MNGERPTEVTALLDRVRSPDVQHLPHTADTLAHVSILDVRHITLDDLCPHDLHTRGAEIAYSLLILLQLRVNKLRANQSQVTLRHLWERWRHEAENLNDVELLEGHIENVWNMFLAEYRSSREIDDVLWLAFPESESNPRTHRVVDFIYKDDGPKALLSHRLVYLSLLRRWKYGNFLNESFGSISPRILVARYDNLATPRIHHVLDLVSRLIFLVLLAHFLLYPPIVSIVTKNDVPSYSIREIFIILLSLSFIDRPCSFLSFPPLITFFTFLLNFPDMPLPHTNGFFFLHLSFTILIFQLHLPFPPSPIFLLPFQDALPLSVLFREVILHAFWPAVKYFFPVLIAALVLLSYSLADTFMNGLKIQVTVLIPPPMETRSSFILLLAIVLMLFISSLFTLMVSLFKSPYDNDTAGWDRYTTPIGIKARRRFVSAVTFYSKPYIFPPPLNLLQILLIRLPSFAMYAFGTRCDNMTRLEKILWRTVVGPISSVVWVVTWASYH